MAPMTDKPVAEQVREALAKATPCPKCNGDEFLVTNSSHAEHDSGCDGSCRNCPVEVPDQDVGPCDCVMQQANVTEADYQRAVGWLRALLAERDAARREVARLTGLVNDSALFMRECVTSLADSKWQGTPWYDGLKHLADVLEREGLAPKEDTRG